MSNIYPALGALIGGGTGALDKIDGAILVNGDAAVVILDTGVYHYHLNATSGATENSPYVISPDSNPGTKRWILVAPVVPFSRVEASEATGQSVPDGVSTTIIYNSEIEDFLDEYNNSTGIFTAKHTGRYLVTAQTQFVSAAWDVGDQCRLFIFKDTAVLKRSVNTRIMSGTNTRGVSISTPVSLAVSEALHIESYQNSGASLALDNTSGYNNLTIDRIA